MHISPDDKRLQYCGRIDFDDPKAPVLVYAASFVQIRFTGTQISVTLENKRAYWSSRMGYILDGKQGQFLNIQSIPSLCLKEWTPAISSLYWDLNWEAMLRYLLRHRFRPVKLKFSETVFPAVRYQKLWIM